MIPEFDRLADNYEEMLADPLRDCFARSNGFFHRRKLEVLLRHLHSAGRSPACLSWLDLGCGKGELLRIGEPAFGSVAGCDVSPALLQYCQGINVREQRRPDTIPFATRSFDLVTAACVYHHVAAAERLRLTQCVYEVLKPGGLFVLFEHNPRNPLTRLIVSRCPMDANAALLSSSESVALLKKAGFIRPSVEYFLFMPEAAGAAISSAEHWLRRLPLGGQYAVFGELPGSSKA